ncbi:MAG: proline dehydrogenase family protein, partial [Elusimicrobiota bacterium]
MKIDEMSSRQWKAYKKNLKNDIWQAWDDMMKDVERGGYDLSLIQESADTERRMLDMEVRRYQSIANENRDNRILVKRAEELVSLYREGIESYNDLYKLMIEEMKSFSNFTDIKASVSDVFKKYDLFKYRPGQEVRIFTQPNTDLFKEAMALYDVLAAFGARPTMILSAPSANADIQRSLMTANAVWVGDHSLNKLDLSGIKEFVVDSELAKTTEVALDEFFRVDGSENFVLLANPYQDGLEILLENYRQLEEKGMSPLMFIQPTKTTSDTVDKSFNDFINSTILKNKQKTEKNMTYVLAMGKSTIGNIKIGDMDPMHFHELEELQKEYDKQGQKILIRSVNGPGITKEMYNRAVPADYKKMRANADRIAEITENAVTAHVTTPLGTDLVVDIEGRKPLEDVGKVDNEFYSNIPTGESFFSPVVGSLKTNGVIAFDVSGTIIDEQGQRTMKVDKPVFVRIKNGYIAKDKSGEPEIWGDGEATQKLIQSLKLSEENILKAIDNGEIAEEKKEEYLKYVYHIGEFAFPLNELAEISGNLLEEEKVKKTNHFAFGSNYDGDAITMSHFDWIFKSATIELTQKDGSTIMMQKNGDLLLGEEAGDVYAAERILEAKTEAEVMATGTKIFELANKYQGKLSERFNVTSKIMGWGMKDEYTKLQLLYFIDVLPKLTDKGIVSHMKEYFPANEKRLPLSLRAAVLAGRGAALVPYIGPKLVAAVVRYAIKMTAKNFFAGETIADVTRAVNRSRKNGMNHTVDVLGEAVLSESEADEYVDTYVEKLLEAEGLEGKLTNVSLKLTSLYPEFDPTDFEGTKEAVKSRLKKIVDKAKAKGVFVNVDIEQYAYKELTIQIFKEMLLEDEELNRDNFGIAIQLYLKESEADMKDLVEFARENNKTFTVRLVKGAYWEYETLIAELRGWEAPVLSEKYQSDLMYENITDLVFENIELIRPAFATHNIRNMAYAITKSQELGIDPSRFEFQLLYGMGGSIKKALKEMGYEIREYTPFGKLIVGMAYLVRRILENTSNDSFLRLSFVDKEEMTKLLAKPAPSKAEKAPAETEEITAVKEAAEGITPLKNLLSYYRGIMEDRRSNATRSFSAEINTYHYLPLGKGVIIFEDVPAEGELEQAVMANIAAGNEILEVAVPVAAREAAFKLERRLIKEGVNKEGLKILLYTSDMLFNTVINRVAADPDINWIFFKGSAKNAYTVRGISAETPEEALSVKKVVTEIAPDLVMELVTARTVTENMLRRGVAPALDAGLRGDTEFVNEPTADFSKRSQRNIMEQELAEVGRMIAFRKAPYPIIIGDREIKTSDTLASLNPADPAQVVGRAYKAGIKEAEEAVRTAKEASEKWSKTSAAERAEYLFEAARIMKLRKYELAAWMTYEVGKNWSNAMGDVDEAIDFLNYYAYETLKLEVKDKASAVDGFKRVPRGVCAVISPWNFPLAILAGMTAGAVATGNTAIMKPAGQSIVIAYKLMEIFREAGLPAGVVNYLPGSGREIGDYLVEHPDVDMITFTGSEEVGLSINEKAAAVEREIPKKVIAEMGGKDTLIVDSSADLDQAVVGAVASVFGFAGQKCSACSRVVVTEDVYEEFLERLKGKVESISVGDPRDPSVMVNPVVDAAARDKAMGFIERAKKAGIPVLVERDLTQLIADGSIKEAGFYVPPTVFRDVPRDSEISQNEIFAPVLAVLKAKDFNDALDIANDTRFALTGGIYSRTPSHLERAKKEFKVGNFYINRGITGAIVFQQPFGGFKRSGIGLSKAGGPDYLYQFMRWETEKAEPAALFNRITASIAEKPAGVDFVKEDVDAKKSISGAELSELEIRKEERRMINRIVREFKGYDDNFDEWGRIKDDIKGPELKDILVKTRWTNLSSIEKYENEKSISLQEYFNRKLGEAIDNAHSAGLAIQAGAAETIEGEEEKNETVKIKIFSLKRYRGFALRAVIINLLEEIPRVTAEAGEKAVAGIKSEKGSGTMYALMMAMDPFQILGPEATPEQTLVKIAVGLGILTLAGAALYRYAAGFIRNLIGRWLKPAEVTLIEQLWEEYQATLKVRKENATISFPTEINDYLYIPLGRGVIVFKDAPAAQELNEVVMAALAAGDEIIDIIVPEASRKTAVSLVKLLVKEGFINKPISVTPAHLSDPSKYAQSNDIEWIFFKGNSLEEKTLREMASKTGQNANSVKVFIAGIAPDLVMEFSTAKTISENIAWKGESALHKPAQRSGEEFENIPAPDFSDAATRLKMEAALAEVLDTIKTQGSDPLYTFPLYINGKNEITSKTMKSLNPADPSMVIGQAYQAGKEEAEKAVLAASDASIGWSELSVSERAEYLRKAAEIVKSRRFELAAWMIYEVGKTWGEALGDIDEVIDFLDYYPRQAAVIEKKLMESGRELQPRGVAAVIAPWNFPLAILAGMSIGSLIMGNTVIMKPASQAFVVAHKLTEIFAEAGLPDGVFSYLPGSGSEIGNYLVEHPLVDIIAFTGSKDVGLDIYAKANKADIERRYSKKVIAEMGGKDGIIVDSSADIDDAVAGTVASAFGFAGQKCSACSRVIVHEDVYDEFCEKLKEKMKSVRVGDQSEFETLVNPVIDVSAKKKIEGYVKRAKEAGIPVLAEMDISRLIREGKIKEDGNYVAPIVFMDVSPADEIAQEEIFGPVLAVIKASDFDEAMKIANGTKYALTGGIYSRTPAHLERARDEFEVGNLYVNRKITGAVVSQQPFGGFKLSGIGLSKGGGPDYLYQFAKTAADIWSISQEFSVDLRTAGDIYAARRIKEEKAKKAVVTAAGSADSLIKALFNSTGIRLDKNIVEQLGDKAADFTSYLWKNGISKSTLNNNLNITLTGKTKGVDIKGIEKLIVELIKAVTASPQAASISSIDMDLDASAHKLEVVDKVKESVTVALRAEGDKPVVEQVKDYLHNIEVKRLLDDTATVNFERIYIDGRWVKSKGTKEIRAINPANKDQVLGIFKEATHEEVDRAVAAARSAFEGWKDTRPAVRAGIILKAANILRRRKEEIAWKMTLEMGKVLTEARGDVQEAIDILEYMAQYGRSPDGLTVPSE